MSTTRNCRNVYHGRAANETKNFLDFELRPLIRRMLALGVDTETLKRTFGHGMPKSATNRLPGSILACLTVDPALTNAQARQLLSGQDVEPSTVKTIKGVPQDKLVEIGELASMSDAILKRSQELLVPSGLESKQKSIRGLPCTRALCTTSPGGIR